MGKQLPGMSSPPASNTSGFGQNLGQMGQNLGQLGRQAPAQAGALQRFGQSEQFNRQQNAQQQMGRQLGTRFGRFG